MLKKRGQTLEMEFWLLTEKGRGQVREAEREAINDEAKIIVLLDRIGSATIEEIARKTGLTEYNVKIYLKRLSEKTLVRKKTTKFTAF